MGCRLVGPAPAKTSYFGIGHVASTAPGGYDVV